MAPSRPVVSTVAYADGRESAAGRLRRWAFNSISLMMTLVCVALIVAWIGSYFRLIEIVYTRPASIVISPGGWPPAEGDQFSVWIFPGQVACMVDRGLATLPGWSVGASRASNSLGGRSGFYARGWLSKQKKKAYVIDADGNLVEGPPGLAGTEDDSLKVVAAPFWVLVIPSAVLPALWFRKHRRARRQTPGA